MKIYVGKSNYDKVKCLFNMNNSYRKSFTKKQVKHLYYLDKLLYLKTFQSEEFYSLTMLTFALKASSRLCVFFICKFSITAWLLKYKDGRHVISARIMVFILDGCSFHYAHIWSKTGILIRRRHLVTSKEYENPFFSEKKPILHHTCA